MARLSRETLMVNPPQADVPRLDGRRRRGPVGVVAIMLFGGGLRRRTVLLVVFLLACSGSDENSGDEKETDGEVSLNHDETSFVTLDGASSPATSE
jgi:hypothetical protein